MNMGIDLDKFIKKTLKDIQYLKDSNDFLLKELAHMRVELFALKEKLKNDTTKA